MSNEDIVKLRGVSGEYKDTRGGAATIPSAVLGIVKNNVDPTHSGRLEVYLKRMGSSNPDKPSSWTKVQYLSPFFGYTPNTGNPEGYGDYVGNPNSYGFWATPPDIGTEVICIFLNGDANEGYYIGCVPQPGVTQMVPGIGAVDNIIPNNGEAQSYGGAARLPVGESNNANSKQANATRQTDNPRPVHSYQAAIYNKQGLLRDPDRGPISSSSMRETPSRVFGISTPGRPIYQGGFTDETIGTAASDPNASADKFKVIGRVGGHTFVLDDGTYDGRDNLARLRTAGGHTILLNDSAQTLFIMHANGQSYIELGKEGTIDMYSTNSVNIRTQGDLNLHADRNINMFAAKNFNVNAENVQIESEKNTNLYSGVDFAQHVKGNSTTKVDKGMSYASAGDASFASAGTTYVNGPSAVNLNTGSTSLKPQSVKQITKLKLSDTLYDEKVGFAAAPGKLTSIASRAPAHTPWTDANKGVDVKTNLSASANFPTSANSVVEQANTNAGTTANATTPTLVSTVPNTGTGTKTMSPQQTNAVVSAMAVNAATNTATADIVKQTAGTTGGANPTAALGSFAATPEQLAASGYIKPGADAAIKAAVANGASLSDAIPPNAWTGKGGINNTSDFLKTQSAQLDASKTLVQKSEQALVEKGVLTGKESGNQTAGLVLAGATAGVGPVNDFIKSSMKTATASVTQVSNILNNSPSSVSIGSISDLAQKTGLGLKAPTSLGGAADAMAKSLTSVLPPGALNTVSGTVGSLVAAGNMAAGLADKAMSGLTSPAPSPEGVSKGLFEKITSSFKALKGGEPQNLTTINAKNKAEQEEAENAKPETTPEEAKTAAENSKTPVSLSKISISETLGKAFSAVQSGSVPGLNNFASGTVGGIVSGASGIYAFAKKVGDSLPAVTPSGVDNLPGGTESLSNVVKGNLPQSIPGSDKLAGSLSTIKTGITGLTDTVTGSVSGLKDKLSSSSLSSFASAGLSKNDFASLQGAINSVSAGGAAEVKLPTIAEGTNELGGLISQSKNLLGNDKIPPLNFGGFKPKILSPAEVAKYDKLKAEDAVLEDTFWDLDKVYRDYRGKYGSSATETIAAKQALDQCIADRKAIAQEMANISMG